MKKLGVGSTFVTVFCYHCVTVLLSRVISDSPTLAVCHYVTVTSATPPPPPPPASLTQTFYRGGGRLNYLASGKYCVLDQL